MSTVTGAGARRADGVRTGASALLARLLPPGALAAESVGEPPPVPLFDAEEAIVARAVPRRRRDFAAVRGCARAVLADLGLGPVPVLHDRCGAPLWPRGLVGSLTHCTGYRAAVVARRDDVRSIGIDAEPARPLPPGVLRSVADDDEGRRARAAVPSGPWDRLLFSAKEAVYKAWYPLTGTWLGFEDVDCAVRGDGTFAAELRVVGPVVDGVRLRGFTGRWLVADGVVLTAVHVAARAGPAAVRGSVPSAGGPGP